MCKECPAEHGFHAERFKPEPRECQHLGWRIDGEMRCAVCGILHDRYIADLRAENKRLQDAHHDSDCATCKEDFETRSNFANQIATLARERDATARPEAL